MIDMLQMKKNESHELLQSWEDNENFARLYNITQYNVILVNPVHVESDWRVTQVIRHYIRPVH